MLSKMLRGSVNNTTNPAAPTDANFKQVSLLLHGDGTNGAQNNTFLDSSTNNFTVTRNGNTTQGTNTPFSQAAGYWSNYFNGTTDYLTGPSNAALSAGTGAFTFETFFYVNSFPYNSLLFYTQTGSSGLQIGRRDSGSVDWGVAQAGVAWVLTSTTLPTVGQWNHMVVVRNGSNNMSLFLNGIRLASTATSYNFNQNGFLTGYVCDGYLSNTRYVVGTAVYDPTSTTLTVPTAPLTAITNTVLLTCQSNYFKDSSSNNFALTITGTPSVQPFSPFAPTSAYSTSVNGGSMYFDGTGDNLTTANSTAYDFGSNNFTIECWVYTGSTSQQTVIERRGTGYTTGDWVIFINESSTVVSFYSFDVGSPVVSGTGLTLNSWNHIAVVRNGTTFTLYLNGVSISSLTSSTAIASNSLGITVGQDNVSGGRLYFSGYISNARIVKGTAVYTANFTPPTAPLTAITNTSLLLSGTNAGIFDNAIKNDLETVGSTQVSTSVVKYGTGSMKFNGTTDYLNPPTSPQFAFGTGNWTIEGWVYSSSVTALQSLIDTRATATSTSGVLISITALGFISVTVNNTILFTSSTAMTLSTWTHVAVVQNGTTITLYLDGTKPTTGSGTSSTSLTDQYLRLGASAGTAANFYNGYLDDVRITKGIARYTANFTPPTSAFPNQ